MYSPNGPTSSIPYWGFKDTHSLNPRAFLLDPTVQPAQSSTPPSKVGPY